MAMVSDGSVLGAMDAAQGWKLYNHTTQLSAYGHGKRAVALDIMLTLRSAVAQENPTYFLDL